MGVQNKVVNIPDLRTLFDQLKEEIKMEFNCHTIGTVQLFDPVTQTAQVSINFKRTFFTGPTLAVKEYVDYPVLLEVPVIVMSGGLFATLTFPITIGDTCVVLFNDRDLSDWFASGQVLPVPTQRMHSISDGIALVGVRSMLNPVLPYDPVNASLQYGASSVKVGPAGVILTSGPVVVAIPAAGGGFSATSPGAALGLAASGKYKFENAVTSMLTVLDGLINVIKALQTQTVTTSELANVTAASQTILEGYKTTIAGLLE